MGTKKRSITINIVEKTYKNLSNYISIQAAMGKIEGNIEAGFMYEVFKAIGSNEKEVSVGFFPEKFLIEKQR